MIWPHVQKQMRKVFFLIVVAEMSKMSKTSNIFEILEASSSEKSVGEVP